MTDRRGGHHEDSPMGSSPRADGLRPHYQPPRPPMAPDAWDEKPTVLVQLTQLGAPVRPQVVPPQLPAPPLPRRPHTLRERVVGQTSMVVISLMLVRLIWHVVHGLWDGRDIRFAAVGAGIYVMALLISSPARRLRSTAVGVMCGLVWSYALVDPSQLGTPALAAWPAVFPIGVLAVLVEIIFTDVIRAHRGRFGGHAGSLAAGLPRPAIALQVLGILLFVVPVLVMCVTGGLAYGFGSEHLTELADVSISLPPLTGTISYITWVWRRLRTLRPKTART